MYYDSGALVALAGLILFLVVLALASYVVSSIFLMKLFEKAGVQGKWRAWVPIYNMMVFAKLGDLNPWWVLVLWGGSIVLSWIPVVGTILAIAAGIYAILAAWRIGLTVCSQCPQGAVSLGTYETSSALKKAGAVSGLDMTTEAAVAKLYYLFSCGYDKEKIKQTMEENLRGEISVS